MSIHSLIEHKDLLLPRFCQALSAISVTLGLKFHPFFQAKGRLVLKNSREKKGCAGNWIPILPAVSHYTLECAAAESVSHFRFKTVLHNSHQVSSISKSWPECISYLLPDLWRWPLLCYNDTMLDAQAKWIKPLHLDGGIQKMLWC